MEAGEGLGCGPGGGGGELLVKYTVIGLVNNNAWPRSLTVAGVIEGDHNCVDDGGDAPESAQRWASSYDADDPAEAEDMAHAAMLEEFDEGDEE